MADEEVALSIEETNRLRASLGLKPLAVGAAATPKPKQQEPKAPKAADADELRNKITEAREKRRREAELRQTKTLGEASPDVDDVANWIAKIKPGSQTAADDAEQQQTKPSKRQKRPAAAGSDDETDGHTAADLAGVAVRHDVSDLAEGEAIVLTLADTGILDEKGNLVEAADQLVDVLSVQEKARRKARAAASKQAKPLWEEDGKVRGLLDKYDEEEEEAAAAFDGFGQLLASRQQELKAKLAAGAANVLGSSADAAADGLSSKPSGGGDYLTAEEAAASKTDKKKKKKRKLRTTKVAEDEGEGVLDLDALEAAAATENAAAAAADLGSREAREARQQQQEQQQATAAAERAARFEAALGRANIASAALRQAAPGAVGSDDDADNELTKSLERARRLAQKAADTAADAAAADAEAAGASRAGSSLEEIARQLAKRREDDEAKLKEQIAAGGCHLDCIEVFYPVCNSNALGFGGSVVLLPVVEGMSLAEVAGQLLENQEC
eukprot:GHRR01002620.1.p1 GENE.GHRR01002620.1~~GHRR01002620.1.p1  ORF type:complete len:500 (+),score=248.88 GHRR01002620.1:142-1641(+)